MKNLYLVIILLLLTGCASLSSQPIIENGAPLGHHYLPWPKRQAELMGITKWSAEGSIAAHNSHQGVNASFHWEQQGSNYTLDIFGPLGVNRVQLSGNTTGVTLKTADHIYTADTPEQLLQQQLGWSLPVSNLYYWLRGLPSPGSRFGRSLDPNNHLVHLVQGGWDLLYLRYLSINGIDLPDRILIHNPQWQIRLLIRQWQF